MLPLTGATHMTLREKIAENILLVEAEFLRHALTEETHRTDTPPEPLLPQR